MFGKNYTEKKVYTWGEALKALKKGRRIIVKGRWLREDSYFYMEALDYTEEVLDGAEYCIVNDPIIIRKGIQRCGGKTLRYASAELQRNDELVRMALTSDYSVICHMDDDSYDCLFDKGFVKGILVKMANDYAELMKKTWFNVSKCQCERNNLLVAANVFWQKIPQETKDDSEVYDIAKTFVNPELLV